MKSRGAAACQKERPLFIGNRHRRQNMFRTLVYLSLLCLAGSASGQNPGVRSEREKLGAEHFNQAIVAFRAGDYQKSVPLFLSADTLIGDSKLVDRVKLRFALGTAFLETGHAEAAYGYFQWVAIQDSTYPYLQLQMAESARKAGQRDEALKFYHKALLQAKPSEQAAIQARIGELELAAGRLDQALEILDQAISLSPASDYHLLRGQIYDKLAQRIDHAEDESFDYDDAIRKGELTEEVMRGATDLREKALADYEAAARDTKLSAAAGKLVERSNVILENNRQVISEIRYQRENP